MVRVEGGRAPGRFRVCRRTVLRKMGISRKKGVVKVRGGGGSGLAVRFGPWGRRAGGGVCRRG